MKEEIEKLREELREEMIKVVESQVRMYSELDDKIQGLFTRLKNEGIIK